MKTKKIISISILMILVFTLQGCWTWTGGNSNFNTESVKTLNPEKLLKTHSYESGKPFKMRDGITYAPLMSGKGQFNMNVNLAQGFGVCLAAAISKNSYIQAGISNVSSFSSTPGVTSIHVKDISYYMGEVSDIHEYDTPLDYTLEMTLESRNYFFTFGKYKTFHKSGRFEYCAGVAYGTSENNYKYNMQYFYNYEFLESRKHFQYFIQSDLGYVTKFTEGALIIKGACFDFFDQQFEMDYPLQEYQMQGYQFVLQPAVKFGFGGNFRAYIQCGWNIPLGNNQLEFFKTNLQVGAILKINEKLGKSK